MSTTPDDVKKQFVNCIASLVTAIQHAGGGFSEDMLHMTVCDFIAEVVAQNNIRFTFVPLKSNPPSEQEYEEF